MSAKLADQLQPLMAAIAADDTSRSASLLRALAQDGSVLPTRWLEATAESLDHRDFDRLSEPFAQREFVGDDGHFLVVAPYMVRREGVERTRLSALLARVMPHQTTLGVAAEVEAIQRAPLRQPVQSVLPFIRISACGNLGDEEGEAFVVPDGWVWQNSVSGLALNDMAEQGRRFEDSGRRCIEQIFDADTAALLLAPLDPNNGGLGVRHRSYEIHDAGHAAGIGLMRKANEGLIPGFWYRAVEEWRADGIGFELGARLLSEELAGWDIASNFCVRFGIDAHRSGTVDGDIDVACTLLILDRMLRQGALRVRAGRLALADVSYRGLVCAMEMLRHDTIELTRRELQLEHATGVMRLYGSLDVHGATEAILEGVVREPCRGFFSTLR